jgi:hypothetical protein
MTVEMIAHYLATRPISFILMTVDEHNQPVAWQKCETEAAKEVLDNHLEILRLG